MLVRAVARHDQIPVRFLIPGLARSSAARQDWRRSDAACAAAPQPVAERSILASVESDIRNWGDEAMNPTNPTSGLTVPMLSVLSVLMATAWLVVH